MTAPTMFGMFRKRTYTIAQAIRDMRAYRPFALRALAIWRGRRMPASLREQIMIAVSRVNGCRYCTFVHQEWAVTAGVPDDEIARLEGLDPDEFDRRRWVALAWAQSAASNDFGPVAPELEAEMTARYDQDERADIETVARTMTLVNRAANTIDALLSRMRGHAAEGSRAFDEVVIVAALFVFGPVFVPWFSIKTRKSPLRLLREFRSFSNQFDRHDTSRP